MEISQVRVRNYKSILDTEWVKLEDDTTTLVGQNESGKTSFLEAINSFEEEAEYEDREISDYVEDEDKSELPIISVKFQTTDEDFEKVDSDKLKEALRDSDEIVITKYADGSKEVESDIKKHFVNIDEVKEVIESQEEILKEIRDDFNDTVNRLNNNQFNNFIQDYNNDVKSEINSLLEHSNSDLDIYHNHLKAILKELKSLPNTNNNLATETTEDSIEKLEEIVEEISQRKEKGISRTNLEQLLPSILYYDELDRILDSATLDNLEKDEWKTFRNLLKLAEIDWESFEDYDDRKISRELGDANTKVRGQINELWEQKEVDAQIFYNDGKFSVMIKDERGEELERKLVSPSDRSKGFQWFLSFYINFMHMKENDDGPNVILLDDPAVFLHPKGKRDWLDAIKKLADDHQIVYTSHSPYLISKKHPERLRIFEDTDDSGVKVTEDLTETEEESLKPVRKALGIGLGDSPFVSKRKILVEGVSDYYILNALLEYLDDDIVGREELTILPVDGAPKMPMMAKWVATEDFSFAVILDKDNEGGSAKSEILDHQRYVDEEQIVQWEKEGINNHIEIEDMFAPEFYIECLNEAYSELEEIEFEPLSIEETDDGYTIEGEEYTGRKIVSKIENIFGQKGLGDLDKGLVAQKISEKIKQGDVQDEEIEQFKPVLGKVRNALNIS